MKLMRDQMFEQFRKFNLFENVLLDDTTFMLTVKRFHSLWITFETILMVAVRPAMLYGLETVTLELKMLQFSLGMTRMDTIRNEYIRGTAQVGRFGEKTRGKTEVV